MRVWFGFVFVGSRVWACAASEYFEAWEASFFTSYATLSKLVRGIQSQRGPVLEKCDTERRHACKNRQIFGSGPHVPEKGT